MKKVFSLSSLIILTISLLAQVPKKVVVEHFTNTRCSICASRNPGFYNNLWNHPDILHISYHPSAPYSNCFLNNHNSMENDDRTKYYGLYGSTPKFTIQGDNIPSSQNVSTASLFTPFTGQTSEASISISQMKYGGDSIQVFVSVKTEANHSYGNLRLFVALVEDTVAYNAPNGENEHYDVFRKALTDIEGDVMTLPSNVGDSISFVFSSNNNSAWSFNRIYALAILQDESSKDVVQSAATMSDPTGSPVGVKELSKVKSLIYPNPAKDVLHVDLYESIQSIRVISITGKEKFFAQNLDRGLLNIDVSSFERGLYFLELTSEGNRSYDKIVIE